MITDSIKEQLAGALADLHMLGYEEGYNEKAIEINRVYKDGNNALLRVEATNLYLEALSLRKTYEARGAIIIERITELMFEGRG